jgi:hypothetical protein
MLGMTLVSYGSTTAFLGVERGARFGLCPTTAIRARALAAVMLEQGVKL